MAKQDSWEKNQSTYQLLGKFTSITGNLIEKNVRYLDKQTIGCRYSYIYSTTGNLIYV